MQLSGDTILIIIGLTLNMLANLGGLVKIWMSFERRMTVMETRLEYHLPKRKNDRIESDNS